MTGFTDNLEEGRYEMTIDGGLVFAEYTRDGDTVLIRHVEAEPRLRGTGAAGLFMQAMVDHARAEGLKLRPLCSYAAVWLTRYKDSQDVLSRGF